MRLLYFSFLPLGSWGLDKYSRHLNIRDVDSEVYHTKNKYVETGHYAHNLIIYGTVPLQENTMLPAPIRAHCVPVQICNPFPYGAFRDDSFGDTNCSLKLALENLILYLIFYFEEEEIHVKKFRKYP